MKSCIFCKIVKGEIPATKIYEDEDIFAFLDIMPINKGHVLVIPKDHYETVMEIPDELFQKQMSTAKKIAQAVSGAIAPDGFNIFINNGKAAGQEVPHIHVHIAPRFKDDGQKMNWKQGKYRKDEMQKVADKIKSFIEN